MAKQINTANSCHIGETMAIPSRLAIEIPFIFFVHPPIADKVRQTPNANKKEKKLAGRLMGLVTKD